MNRGRLVLGIGLIVLAASIFYISSSANWQVGIFDEGIEDDGSRITETDSITAIHSIKADGVVTLKITTGDSETVRYVYNNKLYKNKSRFENGVLNIDFNSINKGFKFFGSAGSGIKVYATVKSLKRIEMDGVGSVRSTNELLADDIRIINEGTGSMRLEVNAHKIKARNAGVGSLRISGKSDTATLTNQGVGSLKADQLIVQVLRAQNDGVGSMRVHAEDKIALQNSGVGSLEYSGDAEVTSSRSDGIGSISKK